MRFFRICLAPCNIIGTSHDRSTESHTCVDSQSLPRPMTVARYKITQHALERQRPMSLRSAQQVVSCFGRPHLFTPRSFKRIVFTNTPNADITMRNIYIYVCIVSAFRYSQRKLKLSKMRRSLYYISLKLFIIEQLIKINYTILYKLLDNNNLFGSYNRAKQAYETVHHHMHAILQDSRRSSVWRLRLLSFSVWDAVC